MGHEATSELRWLSCVGLLAIFEIEIVSSKVVPTHVTHEKSSTPDEVDQNLTHMASV